jgi:hypothetical protein
MKPRRAAVSGAVCAALALSACGESEQRAAAPAVAPIRTANCSDWNRSSGEQRAALLTNLYAFYVQTIGGSGTTPTGPGPTITAKQATAVFDNYCAQTYAKYFKLYKLYGRAAAFSPTG